MTSLAATVAFVTMALHDGNPVPAFLLFYLPLGLSAILLNINMAMALSAIVAAVLLVNHSVTFGADLGASGFFSQLDP